MIQKYLLATEL